MSKEEDLTNVPASVLKQQREAERKIKEAQGKATQEADQNQPVNTVNDEPAVDEPAQATAQPAAQAAQPAIEDGTHQEGQWEHKYNVLQGKYNKEISDLKGLVDDLRGQMERQDVVIQGLNSQQSAAAPTSIDLDDLDPEDFQGWGDEMKVMVTTINKLKGIISDQSQIISDLKGRTAQTSGNDNGLASRVENLESEANEGRIASYLKYLDDNIKGDWRKLNVDQRFISWLAIIDPISMKPRKEALGVAAQNLRGAQVASIFNLYIAENGNSAGVSVADELPSGGGDGGGDFAPKATLTSADVQKAQSDFVKGRITEAEFDKIYSSYQSTLRRQARQA
jgi:hypothetical protein